MRKFILAFYFLLPSICFSQAFPVETVFENGSIQSRINLVFVPDGYKEDEMGKFRTDVENMLTYLFNQEPYGPYRPYFNAYLIKVPSVESGASHPRTSPDGDCPGVPVGVVNNYFGSSFDSFNIHRLLVPTKWADLANVLFTNFPQYDQAFIVVNTSYYGGSGGQYATFSTHNLASEVGVHEMGHSFTSLSDEYWAGPSYAREAPNMTQQTNPAIVKWSSWMGFDNVGIYPHAEGPAWFRPHQNCKMRIVGAPFCPVCKETAVERIHTLAPPLQSFSPQATTLQATGELLNFSVNLIEPQPNSMSVTWKLNNTPFGGNQSTVSVDPATFTIPSNKIRATISDATNFVRTANHTTSHVYVVEWTVNTNVVTGIEIDPTVTHYAASVYPNPVEEKITLSYSLENTTAVRIAVTDMTGRSRTIVPAKEQPAGNHSYEFESDNLFTRPGEYIVTFWFDDTLISKKVIKK